MHTKNIQKNTKKHTKNIQKIQKTHKYKEKYIQKTYTNTWNAADFQLMTSLVSLGTKFAA